MFKKVNLFQLVCVFILMNACTPDLLTEEYPLNSEEVDDQSDAVPVFNDDTGDDQSLEPDNEKDG